MKQSPVPNDSVVEFTNLEKVLWPDEGVTKGDLLDYFRSTASAFLPHFRDRPVTMRVYPRGIDQPSFYRRELPEGAPASIRRVAYETATDRHKVELPIIDTLDDALALANAGAIEFHLWASRAPRLDKPDVAIFDLDSGDAAPFDRILAAAAILETELSALNLRSCPKTSGGKGMHVYVPIEPSHEFDDVRAWVEAFARHLAMRHPAHFSLAKGGTHRDELVTIDYAQNSIGRNTAAPYTVRARPGAPVSTPLSWDEVRHGGIVPLDFTLRTVPNRIEKLGDLFAPVLARDQRLPPLSE
ncbi:MAG: non-homologous end-joining DNA ligase [Rhizobiales bacterium]|nr:non-homologous end-joining DNA ligase [Hyphomicrobiales bacterium]